MPRARRSTGNPTPPEPAPKVARSHNSPGPDDATVLLHIGKTDRAADDASTAHSEYMSAMKAAQRAGLNVKVLKSTRLLKRRPEAEVVSELNATLRYLALRNMPVTQQDLFVDGASDLADDIRDEVETYDANDEGYIAGKNGRKASDHRYHPGGEAAQSFAAGWRRGQAERVRAMPTQHTSAQH